MRPGRAAAKPALYALCALAVARAEASDLAPEWLAESVLADCEYCRTTEFAALRKRLANQAGAPHDPASGVGYIVTIEPDGPFVWGRAALVGTGNLIRTDAHVLYADTGALKRAGAKVYFEPMQHPGASNMIELDLTSVQRGGAVGPLEIDVQNDWAIARLREDAIVKFDGDRVFAFLWDVHLTHDDVMQPRYRTAATLVLSPQRAFNLKRSCASVTGDHPSRYAFGISEVMFLRCPAELMHVGSSGSPLAVSTDNVWHLAGQIVGGMGGRPVHERGDGESSASRAFTQQLVLGNVPMLEQMLAIAYLQELIRRGLDPRRR